jgi:putative ABC transport system substrate-binding protein
VNRRDFFGRVMLGVVAAPLAAEAQHAGTPPRVGYLAAGSSEVPGRAAFEEALRERGWVIGKTLVVEYRLGRFDRLATLAADLVRLGPHVMVAMSTVAARAAKNATNAIPIVMWGVADPVGEGLVASFARPGGNVTGFTGSLSFEAYAKQLQLLTEAVPHARRIALLWNPANPAARPAVKAIKEAAQKLGVELQVISVRGPEEFEPAFRTMTQARMEALLIYRGVAPAPAYIGRLSELSLKHRLPTMGAEWGYTQAGGLMSYAVSVDDTSRLVAGYVDRILRGARPADLPVELPTKFALAINLKTANALGLTIPPSLLMRADQVIE